MMVQFLAQAQCFFPKWWQCLGITCHDD